MTYLRFYAACPLIFWGGILPFGGLLREVGFAVYGKRVAR